MVKEEIEVCDVAQHKGRHDGIEGLGLKRWGQRASKDIVRSVAGGGAPLFFPGQANHFWRKIQADDPSSLYLFCCREGKIAGSAAEVQDEWRCISKGQCLDSLFPPEGVKVETDDAIKKVIPSRDPVEYVLHELLTSVLGAGRHIAIEESD